MLTKINVTDQNIRDGRAKIDTAIRKKKKRELNPKFNYCAVCPIALALREVIDEKYWDKISVGGLMIGIDDYFVSTPNDAYKFIHAFDRESAVNGFSFDLEIPAAYLKQN